ncbi:hypothetical protein F383_38141 [Gossypium arboreum]|uniref:Uncharacterized protein n=1 Tax=Gossypium arboreum TaxID=29729 RepID=A0A0B0MDZ2_GOSAR|nr:hypothetical protein F383_38141 [Gossypium arboreum]
MPTFQTWSYMLSHMMPLSQTGSYT